MTTSFRFNPLDFNFRPLSDFPELSKDVFDGWVGTGDVYIKLTCFGEKEFYGRKVFWYLICKYAYPGNKDDRMVFYKHSYPAESAVRSCVPEPTKVYLGTVASEEFATLLLYNLMGTSQNEDVFSKGKERAEQDLYSDFRSEWP